MGLIAHPIFSKAGDWPKIIKDQVAKKSSHLKKSRLPAFTKSEIKRLRGMHHVSPITCDYCMANSIISLGLYIAITALFIIG